MPLEARFAYDAERNIFFFNMEGLSLVSAGEVQAIGTEVGNRLAVIGKKVQMVINLGLSPGISHANDLNEKVPLAWEDRAYLGSCPLQAEGTFQVKNSARSTRVAVSADGRGLVSQAGAVLLWETMRVTGLGRGLSVSLERWRAPRAVHDPGKIVADLATVLALGGDCLADIAVLREQPDLAGPVASDPVVSRLFRSLAADGPRALAAIRAARAAARERAWALAGEAAPGSGDGGLVTVDLDATIVIAHSEKEQASPTWKKTFGHHPVTAWADHGQAGNGEPLAIVLRAGNAGSDTAADDIEAARLAIAQLPRHLRRRVLVRADSGGSTHEFLKWLTARSRRLHYSVGMTITEAIAEAIGKVPADAWTPAYDGDGEVRQGAWVADITGLLDTGGWPAGMRVIVRKERPHPGAQLRFTDIDGHRFTAFATDTKRGQLADLELRHRRRARCEDRIVPQGWRRQETADLHVCAAQRLVIGPYRARQLWCKADAPSSSRGVEPGHELAIGCSGGG
jgi:DDE family transposase